MSALNSVMPLADSNLVILIPLFNDWVAVDLLLNALDDVFNEHGIRAEVLIVDDGSTDSPLDDFTSGAFQALDRVEVLQLRRNLGHQRAIAIGLAYLEDRNTCQSIVVMDSDGEDDPRDIPRLFAKFREESGQKIVFAERTRRSESYTFRFFYALFRLLHYLLTGYAVRVGNFSIIPRRRLESLVVVSELWNHYAAAAFKSRQPYCTVRTKRAKRLHGHSSMSFVNLVVHGLSAISVYNETIGVRLLTITILVALSTLGAVAGIAFVRFGTDTAVPGWATYSVGIVTILFAQAVMLALVFSFVTLGGRNSMSFLPRRDYSSFINQLLTVYPKK